MKIVDEFPYDYREIENTWIPMPDGIRLAARVWLPEGAEEQPVPAILEYIPYRKRDIKRSRDSQIHGYFAGHGYACLRVDLRGSGDSEGVLKDEYLQQELDDGIEILRWIAAQPWCNGSVGMIGISWGGFNGLQIAARRPPELGAVISVCSTDDRYADDVHYMGGCLLGDNLSWASIMFDRNSCPPDPKIAGDRWKDMWRARLEGSGLWLNTWLRHQRRDDYWKHGSVCEDFDSIQCPVMAVSGWADGYSNAVFRLLAGLNVPRRGLIGPWSHKYPHLGVPGPAIGFLQESLRWWDQWLKGEDTGIADEPMLRVWMQDSVPPTTSYEHRPGRWIAEKSWPSPNIENHRFPLDVARIAGRNEKVEEVPITVQSPLRLGLFAGKWCSYAAPPDLPSDQREEDGGALVFDSGPLTRTTEIMGAPVVELELSSDKSVAMIAVRLSDIGPDHRTTRVTYGILNLTHRNGHEHPQLLEPDKKYLVRVKLNGVAHSFPVGHRIRVALSTSYWPLAWTPPELTRLTVFTGASRLHLPVRPPSEHDESLRRFPEPEVAPFGKNTMIEPPDHGWKVIRDLAIDESTLFVTKDDGTVRIEDIDLELTKRSTERYTVRNDDPDSARGEARWESIFRRGDWNVRTVTRTVLTSTASAFHLHADLDAYDGERRFFCKSWREVIPREFL